MKIRLDYVLKFYKKYESIQVCSDWNTDLIWDFRSHGEIEFYLENNFRDCLDGINHNLAYNYEFAFLFSNVILFCLAFLELVISTKKIWKNFMRFLKIKYENITEKHSSPNVANFDDHISIYSLTDSDVVSINNTSEVEAFQQRENVVETNEVLNHIDNEKGNRFSLFKIMLKYKQ